MWSSNSSAIGQNSRFPNQQVSQGAIRPTKKLSYYTIDSSSETARKRRSSRRRRRRIKEAKKSKLQLLANQTVAAARFMNEPTLCRLISLVLSSSASSAGARRDRLLYNIYIYYSSHSLRRVANPRHIYIHISMYICKTHSLNLK